MTETMLPPGRVEELPKDNTLGVRLNWSHKAKKKKKSKGKKTKQNKAKNPKQQPISQFPYNLVNRKKNWHHLKELGGKIQLSTTLN